MSSLPPLDALRRLTKRISSNTFLNRELQAICRDNELPGHGVKAQLQKTIIDALNDAYTTGDARAYYRLDESIRREKDGPAPQTYTSPAAQMTQGGSLHAGANPHTLPPITNMPAHGYASSPSTHAAYASPYGHMNGGTSGPRSYQPAPSAMSQHRNSITVQLKAQDTALLRQCADDKSLRVMVFCGAEEHGVQDIAFPHQSEMKVNSDDVKANLRGLKNKPGSTRPVDITDFLRLKIPAYSNKIDFTYALTKNAGDRSHFSQKFWLVINICKSIPVEQLVGDVSRKKISKAAVIRELTQQAHDDEIELSSQVLSLKCPISYMRLITPVRASTCTHVQCFDATSYLQLQQQGPQWVCPVCSKSAPFERLAIDEYVRDILDTTSKSVDQVDIQPDGQWKAHGSTEVEKVKPEPQYEALGLDDDEFEISDISFGGTRSTTTPADYRGTRAPSHLAPPAGVPTPVSGASREGSSISRSGGAAKRTHDVIDLTLDSDDDDDEPIQPAAKRQQFSRPGAAYPSYY